jgi:hypothetical protein
MRCVIVIERRGKLLGLHAGPAGLHRTGDSVAAVETTIREAIRLTSMG